MEHFCDETSACHLQIAKWLMSGTKSMNFGVDLNVNVSHAQRKLTREIIGPMGSSMSWQIDT